MLPILFYNFLQLGHKHQVSHQDSIILFFFSFPFLHPSKKTPSGFPSFQFGSSFSVLFATSRNNPIFRPFLFFRLKKRRKFFLGGILLRSKILVVMRIPRRCRAEARGVVRWGRSSGSPRSRSCRRGSCWLSGIRRTAVGTLVPCVPVLKNKEKKEWKQLLLEWNATSNRNINFKSVYNTKYNAIWPMKVPGTRGQIPEEIRTLSCGLLFSSSSKRYSILHFFFFLLH